MIPEKYYKKKRDIPFGPNVVLKLFELVEESGLGGIFARFKVTFISPGVQVGIVSARELAALLRWLLRSEKESRDGLYETSVMKLLAYRQDLLVEMLQSFEFQGDVIRPLFDADALMERFHVHREDFLPSFEDLVVEYCALESRDSCASAARDESAVYTAKALHRVRWNLNDVDPKADRVQTYSPRKLPPETPRRKGVLGL